MTEIIPSAEPRRVRIDLLDVLRAVALIAMAVYHFTWDLDFNGYVPRGMAAQGGWRLFARCIASSFLFLVGVSLVLAHARRIRWRSFWIREAQIVAGALAITIVTAFVTPDSFVFFGILHQIALASFVGLLFLRAPWPVTALTGIAAVALPFLFSTTLTEPKWLAWIGFATRPPVTNDFVPIFPWTGAVLLGIATASFCDRIDAWRRLAATNSWLTKARPLAWLGRHSLLFYLIHQPVLFGLVAAAAFVLPPDRSDEFVESCRTECNGDDAICEKACGCMRDNLRTAGLLRPLMERRTTEDDGRRIGDMVLECSLPLKSAAP